MKLEKILDRLGSIEKNSFIKVIDNIISSNPKNAKEIEKILSSADRGLKSADSRNISKVFSLINNEFYDYLMCEFQDTSSQLDILTDIIIQDGNCIMKQDWFSRLYEAEIRNLKTKTKKLQEELKSDKSDISEERKRDYTIYSACLKTSYHNDLENNRDARISSDELSIILTLSQELELSQEEIKLINYSILPIKKEEVLDVINNLKNIGVLFFSKKENTIYVADEMVRVLRRVREKEVADKFLRRTLRILREPVINQIARKHNINKDLRFSEKIEEIIKEGISFTGLLKNDIHKKGANLTEKKSELNKLCEKSLGIQNLRGSTIEDKIQSLVEYFDNVENDERINIALDGYEKMLAELNISLPKLNKQIQKQFVLQEEFVLHAEFLLDYNIKPRDILDLIAKDDLKLFISENGIKQRGDDILNILEHYKDAENLFLENYEKVAYRDLNGLKSNGISTKESELGLKFEELTRKIFTELGFNVDEDLKKRLNTNKDMVDILLHIENGDVIIVECKTSKERGYNKFSTVSRQLKAYKKLVEKNDRRVVKILLLAPEFSDDFITDCEMNTELNLSLITASSLLQIHDAFKSSSHKQFPHVLFRDVLINEDRIVKALSK
ncbi:hypothetical protein GCM10007103_35030 [Salinimicrobium marinum]|uniref:Uncharacterized protein n=1 Tax=Salinimicrobium marinum TaxID=680283 RepID=A0A918SMF8_9FLAO|nr:hypothetical protein [Salinimicrobium marinum]GHA51530.1 hypothetical protein GCM10007103_35030 [Salinimicrobium marinum]